MRIVPSRWLLTMIGATNSRPSFCGPSGWPSSARARAFWRLRKSLVGTGCVSTLPSASVMVALTLATAAKLSWISWSVERSMKSVSRRLSGSNAMPARRECWTGHCRVSARVFNATGAGAMMCGRQPSKGTPMPTGTVTGWTLSYDDRGDASAPALVLLHGFPLDARVWEAQAAELSRDVRVITPDLRGFGKSKFAGEFTLEELADDVHALLSDLGALPAVIGGLSMGGYVALAYAKKYPKDLRGLALIDTKADADTTEGKQGREKMIALVREKGSGAVADQMMPKMLAPGAGNQRPDLARHLRLIMEACPPRTIANALAAMRDRPDRTHDLPSIPVPALIIVGEHDAIT